MMCRGIRGATTVKENTREEILEATQELLQQIVKANGVAPDDVAGLFFTTTADLNAEFPAVAARELMGWSLVAMLCGHEMSKPDGLPKCLRILMLVNTNKKSGGVKHCYIRGAKNLRTFPEKAPESR